MKRSRDEVDDDDQISKKPRDSIQSRGPHESRSVPREMEVRDAIVYLEQVRLTFASQPQLYLKFIEILDQFSARAYDATSVVHRIKALFKGHKNLLIGFNIFLPPTHYIHVDEEEEKEEEEKEESPNEFQEAMTCMQLIRDRFSEDSVEYKQFLEILLTHQREQTSVQNVFEKVSQLFHGHQDLISEFARFLPKSAQYYQQEIKRRLAKEKKKTKKKATPKKDDIPEHPPFDMEQNQLHFREHFAKPNRSKYGPSYRLLPKNFPQTVCSERSELCHQVLNDELVSVPAGSEESRDIGSRDTAAETLFQCEDDRTELDIVSEQNDSILKLLAPHNEAIEKGQKTDFDFNSLGRIHKLAIRRIYADKGNDILRGLKNQPTAAIPIIYTRLQQKAKDWEHARKELNRFWRRIYKDNTVVAENQEIARFKRLDSQRLQIQSIVQDAAKRSEYNVDLVTDMSIRSIHKDIFKLIIEQSSLDEEKNQFIRQFYKMVMIPFFGVGKKKEKESQQFETLCESKSPAKSKTQKLYANIDMMTFLSFYQLLFDRLTKANIWSYKQRQIDVAQVEKRAVFSVVNTHQDEVEDQSAYLGTITGAHIRSRIQHQPPSIVCENYYHDFLDHLEDYIAKIITGDKFQKHARRLLGFPAFETLTLDQVFRSMERQLTKMANNAEETLPFMKAFEYEMGRTNKFQDITYYKNIQKIKRSNNSLFLFTFDERQLQLRMQTVDPENPLREKVRRHEQGRDYISHFLSQQTSEDQSKLQGSQNPIMLSRNLRLIKEARSRVNAQIVNSLEIKYCVQTKKPSYVDHTYDVLYRPKKGTPQQQ